MSTLNRSVFNAHDSQNHSFAHAHRQVEINKIVDKYFTFGIYILKLYKKDWKPIVKFVLFICWNKQFCTCEEDGMTVNYCNSSSIM